jgi:hypothetical protein
MLSCRLVDSFILICLCALATASLFSGLYTRYLFSNSWINSTKSPAAGAGNVSEPRLMSQVGAVREVLCA